MSDLVYLFLSQFFMVGALGLQSKFNRDHKRLLMFLNSIMIGYIQADVFIEDITLLQKSVFAFGGATGILIFTDLYEKLNRGVINVHKIIKPHRKNNRKHQASYTRNGGAASLRRRLFSQIQRATEEGNSHQAPTAQGLQKAS
jgi:hypothetical protein